MKVILVVAFIFSLCGVTESLCAGKSIPVIPTNGKALPVIVNGKERTYYSLTRRTSVKIELDGPGQFLISSRLVFPQGSASSGRYTVTITENTQNVYSHSSQTEHSDLTLKNTSNVLGKIRKFTMAVPEGNHTYELHLNSDNFDEVALRFRFQASKNHGKLISLEPLSYDRVVTLIAKEKFITYYVATAERKVQMKIVGPTRIKITSRLNYDEKMKGEQKYAIGIWEGSSKLKIKPLATTKAVGASYQEWKDVVPAKTNSFFYDVPAGEHQLKFSLEGAVAHSVSLKFSIPKKDLNNEE